MAKPKLALIPASQGPLVYSVLPSDGSGDFSFSRGSSATRINSQGLIETVASGDSRLEYPLIDGVVSGCPSLLLEPSRTNLLTYSEDFSNAYWVKSSAIITSNSIISPDGSLNASLLKGDGLSSFPRIQSTVSGSGQISFSVFVKKELSDDVTIYLSGTGIGGGAEASSVYKYTFSTDSFLITSGGTVNSSESTSFGNDWVRLTLNYTTTTITGVRIYPKYASTSTDGVYIYGAQLEQGSYPTSYIPNYGTAAGVTRSAETANGAGDATTFNDSEGVLMAEISALANDGTTRRFGISDGSYSNRITLELDESSNTLKVFVISADTTQYSPSEVLSDITNYNKVAIKYKQNDFALWINGFEFDVDNSGDTPINLSQMQFADGNGSDAPFYGNTKQIQYFQTALTDSELEKISSWTSFTDLANGQLYTIE